MTTRELARYAWRLVRGVSRAALTSTEQQTEEVDAPARPSSVRHQAPIARGKHLPIPDYVPGPITALEHAARLLTPLEVIILGRKAALMAFYGVSWSAIRHWRRGRRRAPQWAVDKTIAELEKRAHALLTAADDLRKGKGPD